MGFSFLHNLPTYLFVSLLVLNLTRYDAVYCFDLNFSNNFLNIFGIPVAHLQIFRKYFIHNYLPN